MTIAAKKTYIDQLDEIEASSAFATLVAGIQKTFSTISPTLNLLNQKAQVPYEGGGLMKFTLETGVPAAQYTSGNKTFTPVQTEALKFGYIPMAMMVLAISYNLEQICYNGGKGKLWDYVKRQVDLARLGFGKTIGFHIFGDGTNDPDGVALDPSILPSEVIQGFGLMLPTTQTSGSYAGTTRSASTTWFNHNVKNITGAIGAVQLTDIEEVISKCALDGKTIDAIPMSKKAFRAMKQKVRAEQKGIERDQKAVDLGITDNISFSGAVMYADPALTATSENGWASADAKVMYFLNLKDAVSLYYDPSLNMQIGDRLENQNNNVYVRKINHGTQLVGYNPHLCGRLDWTA
jgi:hypothetical protein